MARVLVTEKIAQSGLDLLSSAGHEVDVQEGLTPEELLSAIVGAHALIIRSSTQVTAEVLEAGTSLQVVGRGAGTAAKRRLGLDDLHFESRAGANDGRGQPVGSAADDGRFGLFHGVGT